MFELFHKNKNQLRDGDHSFFTQKVCRDSFHSLAEQFESNKHSKGNDAWSHFGTMLFCQFAKYDSLNDIRYGIEESWKAHSDSWIKPSFTGRCCLRNAPSDYPAHVPAILNRSLRTCLYPHAIRLVSCCANKVTTVALHARQARICFMKALCFIGRALHARGNFWALLRFQVAQSTSRCRPRPAQSNCFPTYFPSISPRDRCC